MLRKDLDRIAVEPYWRGERSARELYAELYTIAQNRSHAEAADFLELVLAKNLSEDTGIDHALERLGFFVTAEDPVLSRSLDGGGFALLVYLSEAIPLSVLSRLAACSNRGHLIERAFGEAAKERYSGDLSPPATISISVVTGSDGHGTRFDVPESILQSAVGNQAELQELVERFFLPPLANVLRSHYSGWPLREPKE